MVPWVADLGAIAQRDVVMGELEWGIPMVLYSSVSSVGQSSDSLWPHEPMVLTWDKNPNNLKGLPWWLNGKESACNAGASGDMGLIPGSGRSAGEGNGNPFQYSCLENPVDRGASWATVHGVAKSQTRLKWLSMDVCTIQSWYHWRQTLPLRN